METFTELKDTKSLLLVPDINLIIHMKLGDTNPQLTAHRMVQNEIAGTLIFGT